ncbi:5'-nucleotidase domain-containing protein [Melioribacter roseus P3M-2]|uniref:5'-nucleotidase domain-containing protein n=1 Tax=Melioribacter roseus (strain DSM 23840 / JCM 17771 / VKM B-2668 / P3M-2) TaxID=1191523 RepID=I6Z755_MELRP|nr:5'-nucleotidase domain-containing protein [Melioribacter roseus P3M-2]
MAPSNIFSTDISGDAGLKSGDYFGYFQNTSSAAPQVAGLAGLILSLNNNLSEEEVSKIICYTADDVNTNGFDNETGWGRINAYRALNAINHTTVNGILPSEEIWFGTINLTGNVFVPSSARLTILSSAIIYLGTNSIISTGGTIHVEDGATINGLRAKLKNTYSSSYKGLFSTVQSAIDNAGQLDEIHIVGGPYNENLNISNKNSISIYSGIINGTITATNSPGLQIFGTECNAIYLNNCTFPVFNNVYIYGNGSGTGLSLYNTDYNPGNMFNTMVWNFSTGFYASNSWCYLNSGNIFYENSSGVVSAYNSNLSLYYNELCNISGYHLTAGYGGYIYALGCYYDNGVPRIFQNYGTVEVNGANVCTLPKRSSTAENINTEIRNEPVEGEFKEINNMLYDLSNRVNDDITRSGKFNKEKFRNEYVSVTNRLKNYIERNTDSNLSGAVLTTAVHCFRRIEDYESMKDFLEGISKNVNIRNEIRNLAKRYMIDYYSKKEDFFTALSIADEIIQEEKSNKNFVNDALYARGLIYAHNLKEVNKAKKCFDEIVKNSSDKNLIELAENQLKLLGYETEKEKKEVISKISNSKIEISNYPNPFNPSTVISYQLPERSLVTIKVYDILGREIATLIDEYQEAGTYSVEFSADEYQLSSGIYFYTLKAGNNYAVKKMLLAK